MKDQSGLVLIFVLILLTAITLCIGLVVDGYTLVLSAREAQAATDSAAVAAVNQLHRPLGDMATREQWINTKKAVLAVLSMSRIQAADYTLTESDQFASGEVTQPDLPAYARQSLEEGNIKLTLTRGTYCYTQAPENRRIWVNLENGRHWCLATAVQVDLRVKDIKNNFMQIIGFAQSSGIRAVATGSLATRCGTPLCETLGFDTNGTVKAETPGCV